MNDRESAPRSERVSSLLRDALVIVLAGLALGAGYNQLQLREGGGKGLSWIARERKLASLESLLPSEPGAFAPETAAAPERTDAPEATGQARRPAAGAASSKPESTTAKPAPGVPARPPAAPSASAAPVPPADSAHSAPSPDPPAIPDTREPLEAGYAIVKQLHDAKAALFVDARSAEEFAQGHIAGAVNLPFDDVFKQPDLAKQIDSKGRPIVAYCGGGDCELSRNLAFSLIEAGHRKVLVFTGGTAGWKDAGNALVSGATP